MSESTTVTPTLCRRCGQAAPGIFGSCPHCGSPLAAVAGLRPASSPASTPGQRAELPPADWPGSPTVPAPAAVMPAYRFEPARIASGPRLSRKAWLAIGVSSAVVVLAVAAFLVLRPEPPSPAGTVRDYFDYLGSGDTAAALALMDTGGGFSPGSAPLLVPAALAKAENRPTGATVMSSRTEAGGKVTTVTVTYQIGGHPLEQVVPVVATAEEKTPYRLKQPFLYLTVQAPYGLAVTVNGIAVRADALARGMPAFPGAYQATTTGNALFAGTTQVATYRAGNGGVTANIAFGQPTLAPDAPGAVQAAAQKVLDGNCANPPPSSYNSQCPLRAPYKAYRQTTTWKITTYPQVQLSSAVSGQNGVRFTTHTPGSAEYTITYTSFGGTTQTENGTVPIDIRGYAGLGDDGAIQVSLGY